MQGTMNIRFKIYPIIHPKLAFLKEKLFMTDMIYVHTLGSHNVRTHWMYLPVVNIGLKVVL